MTLQLVTDATAWPVTLAEALAQVRMDGVLLQTGSPEEDLLEDYIAAATDQVERYLHRAMTVRTYDLFAEGFPACAFRLPIGRAGSVVSITYTDPDDAEQTMEAADYNLSPDGWSVAGDWPAGTDVRVRFTTAADVPATVRVEILRLVARLYAQREAGAGSGSVLPQDVRAAVAGWRRFA